MIKNQHKLMYFVIYIFMNQFIQADFLSNTNTLFSAQEEPVIEVAQEKQVVQIAQKSDVVDIITQAQAYIKKSYFSPEMQYSVLALFDRSFEVDEQTGLVSNLPTIEEIMAQIDLMYQKQTHIQDPKVQNLARQRLDSLIMQALQETLEAIDIAIFAASLQAVYQDTKSLWAAKIDQNLNNQLNVYKKIIQSKLQEMHPSTSWQKFWFGGFTPVHSKPDNIQQIIAQHSYKNVPKDPTGKIAANLLFKQCLISQQYLAPFLPFLQRYLIMEFKDYNNLYATVPDIDHAILILNNAASTMLNNPDKMKDLAQIHQCVIAIRKAVQVSLYVANKNSAVNYGHFLPASVTSLLDQITHQLLQYDKKLDGMCKDDHFGATQDDFYRDRVWSTLSSLAAGVAVVGVGAALLYDVAGSRTAMVSDSSITSIQNFINDPQKSMYDSSKSWINAGIRKATQLYKNAHENAVPGKSFWEPETQQAIVSVTSYATRDVAPIVHQALTAKGQWNDPIAKERADMVKKDIENLLSNGIKSGVKAEFQNAVKNILPSPSQDPIDIVV